tara:strand:- start:2367 stop:3272 length:906 start_codon:yes stop_codon:yes gene_type:complete
MLTVEQQAAEFLDTFYRRQDTGYEYPQKRIMELIKLLPMVPLASETIGQQLIYSDAIRLVNQLKFLYVCLEINVLTDSCKQCLFTTDRIHHPHTAIDHLRRYFLSMIQSYPAFFQYLSYIQTTQPRRLFVLQNHIKYAAVNVAYNPNEYVHLVTYQSYQVPMIASMAVTLGLGAAVSIFDIDVHNTYLRFCGDGSGLEITCDFTGVDARGYKAVCAKFFHHGRTELGEPPTTRANLTNTDFRYADFRGTAFPSAEYMQGMRVAGAQLGGSTLPTNPSQRLAVIGLDKAHTWKGPSWPAWLL